MANGADRGFGLVIQGVLARKLPRLSSKVDNLLPELLNLHP
ncbi:hypothetical protein [Phormidium sp. FACHB-1136]|nr:hypothetical protein [Phormidium sp. FACHB-1136]